jgi:adenine-specific DNA-methyltransferase
MFENASIDVMVFRYCKNSLVEKKVLQQRPALHYKQQRVDYVQQRENTSDVMFQDYYVYVGLVSRKEDVYKNAELGNIEVLNGEKGG